MTIRRVNRGRGHSYYDDGTKLDGVTTLIGDGIPKKALTLWASGTVGEFVAERLRKVDQDGRTTYVADEMIDDLAALSAKRGHPLGADFSRLKVAEALKYIPYAERDAAAGRGTEVHELAERLAHGEEVEIPEAIAGHVESAVKFLDEWQARPVLTETTVANRRWQYAGTFDGVFDIPSLGGRYLLDWKTGGSGIYGEAALQVSAYASAEVFLDVDGSEQDFETLGVDNETGYAVWIRSDGYDVYPLDIGPDAFKVFLHAAYVARQIGGLRDLVGQAATPPRLEAVS